MIKHRACRGVTSASLVYLIKIIINCVCITAANCAHGQKHFMDENFLDYIYNGCYYVYVFLYFITWEKMLMFEKIDAQYSFSASEKEVRQFWKENDVFR